MKEKIQVLENSIDICTAKKFMKHVLRFMDSEPISVVEVLSISTLIEARQDEVLKENIESMDLVLPGERKILEESKIYDRCILREVENRTPLKLILRYLRGNHARVYILTDEENTEELKQKAEKKYSGLQIAGVLYVTEKYSDDLIVNAVNGAEVDCVISVMSSPLQEELITRNKKSLNARIWLGGGRILKDLITGEKRKDTFLHFITEHIFKKEVEKSEKRT